MTEARVWTLSQGTRDLLSGLHEPLHLRLYMSGELTEAAPRLAAYAGRVRDTLREHADCAGGTITLEAVDPASFSDEEDRAVGFGIDRIALAGAAEPMFFGLAATNSTDGRATIPVFSPDREAWLEYDLTRLVAELGQPVKPKVALIDGLGLSGNPVAGQPEAQALAMLRELYDVETLSDEVNAFPEGTKVVVVIHPQAALTTVCNVGGRQVETGNPAWLRLGPGAMDRDRPALAQLSALILTTAGRFTAGEGARLVPLLQASDEARLVEAVQAADRWGDRRRLLTEGGRGAPRSGRAA